MELRSLDARKADSLTFLDHDKKTFMSLAKVELVWRRLLQGCLTGERFDPHLIYLDL